MILSGFDWYPPFCTMFGILVGYMLRDVRPVVHVHVPVATKTAAEPEIVELVNAGSRHEPSNQVCV